MILHKNLKFIVNKIKPLDSRMDDRSDLAQITLQPENTENVEHIQNLTGL